MQYRNEWDRFKTSSQINYLGSLITSDGRCINEIKMRMAQAKTYFQNMKSILTNKRLSLGVRKRGLQCIIEAILLLYNTLFSREEIFAKSESEIFSREDIFANILFTRTYLPAKISSRENNFQRKYLLAKISSRDKYLPAKFFRAANNVG